MITIVLPIALEATRCVAPQMPRYGACGSAATIDFGGPVSRERHFGGPACLTRETLWRACMSHARHALAGLSRHKRGSRTDRSGGHPAPSEPPHPRHPIRGAIPRHPIRVTTRVTCTVGPESRGARAMRPWMGTRMATRQEEEPNPF